MAAHGQGQAIGVPTGPSCDARFGRMADDPAITLAPFDHPEELAMLRAERREAHGDQRDALRRASWLLYLSFTGDRAPPADFSLAS